jgi:hypothetical protein
VHVELPLDGNANFLPEGWISHRLASEENGAIVSQITADLCSSCSEKLRHAINPANWPRLDPAIRQFAKKERTHQREV